MNRQPLYLVFLAVGLNVLASVTGCGSGGPEIVPVRGTVLYRGAPLKLGGITFVPTAGRSAFGKVIDGQIIEVTTQASGDGVIVGTASVGIQATTNLGRIQGPHRPLIPLRYFDPATSQLTAQIKADGPNDLKFELVE